VRAPRRVPHLSILRFAVSLRSTFAGASVNWHIVGDILMAVGIVGLIISLIWMATLNRRDRYVATDRYDAARREPHSMS
jgi:hypothetical protein